MRKKQKTAMDENEIIRSDTMGISRLRMGTDGKGVTTLVAFYGCPLNCRYCINDNCHDRGNSYDSPPRAAFTPAELVGMLKKDALYYLMSGGGVVFGGGEPLMQSEFIHEVCRLADSKWNMRIETSLNVPWENIELLIDDIDEWIIDVKDLDAEIYERYTGASNVQMLQNLMKLKELTAAEKLHIRVPRIPGYNTDDHVEYSANWILGHTGVEPEIFDYIQQPHTAGKPKWLF